MNVITQNEIKRQQELISFTKIYSKIYLAIAVLPKIVIIITLVISLIYDNYKFTGSIIDLYHYLPRILLAILVELLSYSYRRSHRQSLDDIKYYNNELTNFEHKAFAVDTAQNNNLPEILGEVIKILAATERNFILKKGQNTIETKKLEIESEMEGKLTEIITSILKKVKPPQGTVFE